MQEVIDMDLETLQLLINRGIIDIDDVAKKLDMEILKDYQDKIWQATDGRYKIKMSDGKLLAKTRREDLEKAIIEYCKDVNKKKSKGPLFKDLYIDWLFSKKIVPGDQHRYAVKESTRTRYTCYWDRHYKDNPIVNMYVKDITKKDVQHFLDGELYKYNMTAKQVNNFKVILKQVMDLAVDRDIIDYNPVDAYKLPYNIKKPADPDKKTQVFNVVELAAIYHLTT